MCCTPARSPVQPVISAICCGNNLDDWHHYDGGVFDVPCCQDKLELDHAIVLAGYDVTPEGGFGSFIDALALAGTRPWGNVTSTVSTKQQQAAFACFCCKHCKVRSLLLLVWMLPSLSHVEPYRVLAHVGLITCKKTQEL